MGASIIFIELLSNQIHKVPWLHRRINPAVLKMHRNMLLYVCAFQRQHLLKL